MTPREQFPTPNHSWPALLHHAKTHRTEVRSSLSLPFNKISLQPTSSGCRVFALGTPIGMTNQTLLSTEINAECKESAFLQPIAKPPTNCSSPSAEFALLCERQRTCVTSGVTDYSIHPKSHETLLVCGDDVMRLSPTGSVISPEPSSTGDKKTLRFLSDVQFCPSDPQLVSYVLEKEVHIELNGKPIFATNSSNPNISNGLPPFITMEELDRFDATWWSPKGRRILYERVDESEVDEVSFVIPGRKPTSPTRYPHANANNAITELRLIDLDAAVNGSAVRDEGMRQSLQTIFPWAEYIARAGFMLDGKTVWVQLMNREQTMCALIVVPESEFEGHTSLTGSVNKCSVVFEEKSDIWINTHQLIVPLESETGNTIDFLCASEMTSDCHIYHVQAEINAEKEVKSTTFRPITSGQFSVCKSTEAVVDRERKLVYFVANATAPYEYSICVAKYGPEPCMRQLTRPGLSYKGERHFHSLSVLPDRGFACFMTSLAEPQHCEFYEMSYEPGDVLPQATFRCNIAVLGSVLCPTLPCEIPQIIEYTSERTNLRHCAMVMRPSNYDPSQTYPVVHYVYGGPGIQIVKNEFSSWMAYLKYTRLGYVVIMIDGRGSANRGRDFEAPIKKNLGVVEMEDQVEGLLRIAGMSNGMMDLSRVVILGWSYGGFMSLLAIARHPQIYRAAIAGGAVTDWMFYDSAYTEKYMGYPAVSELYNSQSAVKLVDSMPDEPGRLLIVHGLIDENVHFKHAEVFLEAMIRTGKPYQLQVFPSERHGVRVSESASHMDATMLHFIAQAIRQ